MLKLKKQNGLSLIELLIGILIGMIVVACAIKIFTGSAKNGQEMTQATRLQRDLRNMMDMMTHEIKRAGYMISSSSIALQTNPFAEINIEATPIKTNPYPAGCITFMYNKDTNIDIVNTERLGFKLVLDTNNKFIKDKQLLRMWKGGATLACDNNNWETITSPDVEITNLNFDLNETKLNVSHPTPTPPPDCNATEKCLIIRTVTITLAGVLRNSKGDPIPESEQTITDTVKIRNDQYCHNGVKQSITSTQCN